jgi:nitroreductase
MATAAVALTPDQLLTTTRAVRRRLDLTRPVPAELLTECLTIAQQAPCEGNMQQWYFIVVTDSAKRPALADCFRQGWEVYKTLPIAAVNIQFSDPERNARLGSSPQPSTWWNTCMRCQSMLSRASASVRKVSLPWCRARCGNHRAGDVELHARGAHARTRHRLHVAPLVCRRTSSARAGHPVSRGHARSADSGGLLHGRDIQARQARATGEHGPLGRLVAPSRRQAIRCDPELISLRSLRRGATLF